MTLRKMIVDARAYSISPVAPNAMAIRETRRKTLFPKSLSRRSGMAIALDANRPWYMMMRENTRGLGLDEKFGGFRHWTEKVFDLTNHFVYNV